MNNKAKADCYNEAFRGWVVAPRSAFLFGMMSRKEKPFDVMAKQMEINGKQRFVIVDRRTRQIVDDAQGWGYRTQESCVAVIKHWRNTGHNGLQQGIEHPGMKKFHKLKSCPMCGANIYNGGALCMECAHIEGEQKKARERELWNIERYEKVMSSGETIIKQFLTMAKIPYCVQYDTLKCINPFTNQVMPYDFELVGKKILIEVQGPQHGSYMPKYHKNRADFVYQQKKDDIKRRYAEKMGYILLELWYEDIDNGLFKYKILECIKKLGVQNICYKPIDKSKTKSII